MGLSALAHILQETNMLLYWMLETRWATIKDTYTDRINTKALNISPDLHLIN